MLTVTADGTQTAVILTLSPLAWKPDARHRSLTGTPGKTGYFSVEDTVRLMQGFVPERSFTKDRRVIDMRIDSALMVCGTSDQCYRPITDFME